MKQTENALWGLCPNMTHTDGQAFHNTDANSKDTISRLEDNEMSSLKSWN